MKGFKFRCFPNESQQRVLKNTFGCCRFIWNSLLSQNKHRKTISAIDLNNQLSGLKSIPDYHWLKEVSSVALQQTAVNLYYSFTHGKTKFKSKHRSINSFRIVGDYAIRIKDNKLFLPKDNEALSIKWSRPLPCKPTSYTVSQSPDGKFWISFICHEYENKLTSGQGTVGIDLGIKSLVVDSNGNKYDSPCYFRKAQKALAKAQRVLSRRKKGSKRREKAKLSVARKHAKIRNQRKDYLHKLTRKLVNENQVIGIEDLYVRGMVKNRRLAKSLMDSGLGMFRLFLTYKAKESKHCVIVILNRWEPSTQFCNSCGTKAENKLKLTTREWRCRNCGMVHDRDINAGLNIKLVANFMVKEHNPPGGSIVLAPPLLQALSIMPRTAVNAQLISPQ